ncbi:MAG: HAD family hydrolase [Lachnotalea sp.]
MNKLINIKGAIFDMDGTLIDSMGIWDNVACDFLKTEGIVARSDLGEVLKSMSMQQGADYVIKEYSLNASTQEIITGVNALIASKYEQELLAKEGVIELVESLETLGVRMCVATASDYHLAEKCLERIGIKRYLEGIYTCGDIQAGKDNPKLFEHAMEKLGTTKEDTYIFEDSLYAIETAKKTGFKVVAVYDESSKKDWDKIKEMADICVTTMNELL